MSGINPSALDEIIRRAITNALLDPGIMTALPGRVVMYYPATQTADVLPMVSRPLEDEAGAVVFEPLSAGALPDLQVIWPRNLSGTAALTMPIAGGDSGLILFCAFDPALWRVSGQSSNPLDTKAHALAHGVFLPGIYPDANPLPSTAYDGAGASPVLAGAPVLLGDSTATDYVALASLVHTELGKIASALSSLIAPALGGPVTGNTYTSPGNVAATKVKAI